MVFETRFEGDLLREHLHDGQEGQRGLAEGVTSAPHNSTERRKHLCGLNIVLDLGLYGLIELDVSEESALRFGLELPVLELLQGLLGDLAVLPDCVKLQMLEVVVITLQRPEGHCKPHRHVGFQYCALRVHLEDSHVLPIEVFLLLSYPGEAELALQPIGDLYLLLAAEGEDVAEAEVQVVVADADQLVLLVLQK